MSKNIDSEVMQNVVFRMTPSEIERLDKMAENVQSTRSQFIRQLIMVGLEETETFQKFGLIRAAITVRDICGWMSHRVSQVISKDMDTQES